MEIGVIEDVESRVGSDRWFVYDVTGEGFPVEPLRPGAWLNVQDECQTERLKEDGSRKRTRRAQGDELAA